MIPLFLGLTGVNLLCLATVAGLGYAARGQSEIASLHLLMGVVAVMVCCAVHCVVFTYFVATAKWVRHAVALKHLDAATATPTRSFKAQAFPAALLAISAVFGAAVSGAAADNYGLPRATHALLGWVAWALNLGMAVIEYRAITRNARLIDTVLSLIDERDSARYRAGNAAR